MTEATPKALATSAVAIGTTMCAVAAAVGQVELARGIAISALVMVINLGLWVFLVRQLFAAAVSGEGSPVSGLLFVVKLTGIGLVVFGLMQITTAPAVLLGGSVVVLSILLHAAVLAVGTLAAPSEA